MRILHILDHSIPVHSGYTFRTLAILRQQRALGWETFHLTSPKHPLVSPEREEVDGLTFYRTPVSRPALLGNVPVLSEMEAMKSTAAKLDSVIQSVRPDVLHAHSPVLNCLPALWARRKHGTPVVYEIRAFWEDAAVGHGTSRPSGLRYRVTRQLETLACQQADAVTTICEGLREDLLARGIPASKITVIPNAVDADDFPIAARSDGELMDRLGLHGCTVLGFFGSFYRYEGLHLLLDAMPSLLREHPSLRLLLGGGGPEEQNVKAQARALSIEEKVLFTGRVAHWEVPRYCSLVDLFVFPRLAMRLTETVTPLKPLEAMAQGKPVVASDVGGHRELIRDGETGFLFRPDSVGQLTACLLDVLRRRAEWPRIRAAGRLFVESERSWARSVAGYAGAYQSILGIRAAA